MAFLAQADARRMRAGLVEDGFCIVPSVCTGDLLERVRDWSDELLDDVHVSAPWRVRAQGDVQFVQTPRAAGKREPAPNHSQHPLIEELFDLEPAKQACAQIGLEHLRSDGETVILLSKYQGAPALYWHQDLMNWGHASATTPWPTRVFLSYYTVDTNRENGCLRVIP